MVMYQVRETFSPLAYREIPSIHEKSHFGFRTPHYFLESKVNTTAMGQRTADNVLKKRERPE